MESHPTCPTHYCVREADGLIELHVDDGHGCRKETVIAELLAFLSEKIEMKCVKGILCGSYENLKTMKVCHDKKMTSIPNKEVYLQSAMTKMGMSDCKGVFHRSFDKACIDSDNEEMDEEQTAKFKIQILNAQFVVSQQRENRHSKHGAFSVYETEKPQSVGDAATETITSTRQGYRRHGDSVRGA